MANDLLTEDTIRYTTNLGRGCWVLHPTMKGCEVQKMNLIGAAKEGPTGRTLFHLCPHLAWKAGKAATTTSNVWVYPEEVYYTRTEVFEARMRLYKADVEILKLELELAYKKVFNASKNLLKSSRGPYDNKA